MEAVTEGMELAKQLLTDCGIDTTSASLQGFFQHPWKHFPLKDTYVSRAECPEAATANKEDDPSGDDPDEAIDLTTIDAHDAADAEAVMGQLLRTNLDSDEQQVPGALSCACRFLPPSRVPVALA